MKQPNSSFFRKIILITLILNVTVGRAQLTKDWSYYKAKYPKTNVVRLNNELSINIGIEKSGDISITQTSLNEDLFLNEAATQYSKESVSYSTFYKLEKVEASSFSLQDGNYLEHKVTEFRTKDELDGSFYDDVKSVNFIYSNLSPGSKTKLNVVEKVMDPRFLSAFYFGGSYPVLNSKITITADKNVELSFKEFNTDSIHIAFSKKEKRNKVIYTWQSKNIDAIEMEDNTPNFKNYYPHIVPIVNQYQTKDKKVVKLSSEVSDLYRWYYSLVKDINKQALDPDLVTLVNELTKDKKTELEKIRAIYYWVQNNIKYIAFEYALGGFVPREANQIYQKKYGDCKDNSNILYEMLKTAGIKGNLTWIGTRSIPYKYNELPTPAVDNHMILTYRDNDKIYFLDATGRYIPLELPSSFIQGKEALVGEGDDKFEVVEVPVVAADKNAEIDTSFIAINQKQLIGHGSKTVSGYKKINMFRRLESINTQKKLQDYYKIRLQKGNNKFIASNIKEINKYSYDKDFTINYDFKISDYAVQTNDEIYVNLNLDKILLENTIEDGRKTDIEIDYKKAYTFVNELTIPDGYAVDYLPENISVKNHLLSASITYKLEGTKVIYTHRVTFDFLILNKEAQKEYEKLLKKIEKAYKEIIVLKKIN